jgi:DNA-binding winged helix-turn-helix (wHTH) protein/tetratricopeptide (TPR) repeat protein
MATTHPSDGHSAAVEAIRLRFGDFELDEADARLFRQGRPITLAPRPFAVLCALLRRPGALVTKNALLDAVWGHRHVSDSVLKTAISELRAALDDDAKRPRFVETVSRRGYRFIGAPTAPRSVDSPPASDPAAGSLRAPSIIGREAELARLHAAWEQACLGKRTLVWVAGAPGVGKTALIEHFVTTLGDVAMARGSCVEQYGAGEPYLPILEALAELCASDHTATELLRAFAPSWLLQLPWLTTAEERDALRHELVGVRDGRMVRELAEFFDRFTAQGPLLLVTGNLHWSDEATIRLMDHIARRRGHGRLLWIATFRLADIIAQNHPFRVVRNELRLHGLCEEIVLDSFSEKEVADYLLEYAPSMAASEAFVRALHERTEGLPLLVAHIVNDLRMRGAFADGEVRALRELEGIAVPEHLTGIIDHYISRLTSEERAILDAAVVCGLEFRAQTVAAVLERDAADVAASCDALARAQLWLQAVHDQGPGSTEQPGYRFRHALLRQVLYERIDGITRPQLHRRTAVALERDRAAGVPVALTELAMHCERGGEWMAAAHHYAQAAESLLPVSLTEVRRLSERGLAHVGRIETSRERSSLELSLSVLSSIAAADLLGVGCDEAKAAVQRAFALLENEPYHRMRGPLLNQLGLTLCVRAEYEEAIEAMKHAEALGHSEQDPVPLLAAATVASHVELLRGRPRIGREWAERALATCDCLEEPTSDAMAIADPCVTALGLLGIHLLHLGLVEQARTRLEEARARAHACRQPVAEGVAIWFEGIFQERLGDVSRMAVLAEEMQAIVDEFAFAQGRAACQWMRGWVRARRGDPRGGHGLLRAAYEEDLRTGMRSGGSEVLGYAADALLRAGDLDGAERELEAARAVASALGERVYLPQLLLTEAAIAHARGESDRARRSALGALAEAREQEAPWLELTVLVALCERADATREDRRALGLLLKQLPEATNTTLFDRARVLLAR